MTPIGAASRCANAQVTQTWGSGSAVTSATNVVKFGPLTWGSPGSSETMYGTGTGYFSMLAPTAAQFYGLEFMNGTGFRRSTANGVWSAYSAGSLIAATSTLPEPGTWALMVASRGTASFADGT